MPKHEVTDPITDQEMTFARLVLAGTMTDRQAAETAGLDPTTAAYAKGKPQVRDYVLEHRAAVEAKLVQLEAEEHHRKNITRERVLTRLWELADLSPEATRNSTTGQIKALSMIVSIEGLVPDRRTAGKQSEEPSQKPDIFKAQWLLRNQAKAAADAAGLDLVERADGSGSPSPEAIADDPVAPRPTPSPTPAPAFVAGESIPPQSMPSWAATRYESFVPDAQFSMPKKPFNGRR
jgi:hypothetical protein